MPRWWTGWMALVTAVLPGLVFLTSVVTFGLALPFWLIAANLWWVLAFRGVWLFARQSGGRSRAWGALGGAVLAVAGLFSGWWPWRWRACLRWRRRCWRGSPDRCRNRWNKSGRAMGFWLRKPAIRHVLR